MQRWCKCAKDSKQNTSGAEPRVPVRNAVTRFRVNDRKEFSSLDKRNKHVETAIILKGRYQIDHKGMVRRGQHDVLLAHNIFYYLVMSNNNLALTELLQG